MARMVNCVKLGREMPGLDRPPYPGDLGRRIYENVSAMAWNTWKQQSILLINHYGLVLADPEARRFLREQMEQFLFSEDGRMPDGWTPDEMGGSAGKGGPAPAKK